MLFLENYAPTPVVPPPPKATTTYHIIETCKCLDCGKTTGAKSGMVRGTSLGPNLLAEYWEKKGTYEGVADSLENRYKIKTTIQRALDVVAAGLEPEARNMRDSLKDTDYMGYDETPYPRHGKSGWAWVAASHNTISYHLAASRSRATFEEHVMVPGRLATVDVHGCHTAVLSPYIAGCRSRG